MAPSSNISSAFADTLHFGRAMPEGEPTPEEWLEIEAADAYLDALGNARDFEGDDLGGTEFRNDVDREPLGPIDQKALEQYYAERAAEARTAPTTGGTLSIQENAAQIRAVANDSSASGAAQLAASNLGDAQIPTIDSDTVGVLQEGIGGLENGVNVAASAAGSGSEDEQAIRGAGSVAVQVFGVALQLAEQARAAAESAAQAVQQAKSAAEDAIAAAEQFRQACDGVASKHGA